MRYTANSSASAVKEACERNGTVYFCTVGGVATLLAKSVAESELVAWEDLGTEALRRLTLKDFPAFVALDPHEGTESIYSSC